LIVVNSGVLVLDYEFSCDMLCWASSFSKFQ
jgi:hypothetical protein